MKKWLKWLLSLGIVVLALFGIGHIKAVEVNTTFSWTAPGDDGATGQAAVYDLRFTTDTTKAWTTWAQVEGEPTPALAGTVQFFTTPLVLGVGKTYWFGIAAADEVGNWSERSNLVSLYVPDTQGPDKINDFKVEF